MRKALRLAAVAAAPVPVIAAVLLFTTSTGVSLDGYSSATSAQPMVAMPDNMNPAVANSTMMGPMDAAGTMAVSVALKPQDESGLDSFLAQVDDPSSSLYHQFLSPAEYAARFGPSSAQVAMVSSYLSSEGLSVQPHQANSQVVSATGSVGAVQHAFDTTMNNYRQNGENYYANATAPRLPADVAGVVTGIGGLDDHAVFHTNNIAAHPDRHGGGNGGGTGGTGTGGGTGGGGTGGGGAGAAAAVQGLTPAMLNTAYNVTGLGTGSGASVALWEFDGFQQSNITQYDNSFGLTTTTPTTVSVDGANFNANPGGGEDEVELDIELVQALAPAANTFVYEAPNSAQGQIDMASQIAADDKVQVTSISWGGCEAASAPATITATDNALKQGTAEGISFFAAAGDRGSDDCGNGTTAVDYPASDPNVSGAGGTTLTTGANGAYQSETAWSGSGGGVSNVFAAPTFQANDKNATNTNGMRTVPDVAADANPQTGYAIFAAGQWQEFGGTSCAAPDWAGFTALVDASKGTKLGNANTALYQAAEGGSAATAFHDVTSGSNGAFSAAAGYDDVTGWGSFNAAVLAGLL